MSEYPGLLGAISEAADIKDEFGVSAEEAFRIQRERSELRLLEYLAIEQAAAESNVIPFRAKH